ncbi:MAG: hypothetical protein ACRD0P_03825 [Stackebrandtia sp.]
MTIYVYDSGALIAGEKGSTPLLTLHRRSLERGQPPQVPGPVISQVWRGKARNARMARILSECETVLGFTEDDYKDAGRMLGDAALSKRKRPDVVDALVALTAKNSQAGGVVTSDDRDITAYLDAIGYECEVLHV